MGIVSAAAPDAIRANIALAGERDRAEWLAWARERAQDAFNRGRAAEQGGDPYEACRWLERAKRLSSGATHVDVALALARLKIGDARGAAALLRDLLRRFDFREGWTALAAASLALGETDEAARAAQHALSHHAPDPMLTVMLGRIALSAMWPGWCGLTGDGNLLIDGKDAFAMSGAYGVKLDGKAVRGRLPPQWRKAGRIEIRRGTAPLLGSPIRIGSVLRSEGFVEYREGALQGWLWHPGEPERAPALVIAGADGSRATRVLDEFADAVDSEIPLARPRRLFIPLAGLPDGSVHLLAGDGTELTGSPIDPALVVSVVAASRGRRRPVPAAHVGGPPRSLPPNPAFDVVIPVYRHRRRTLDCIESVRDTLPPGSRIVVVEDASPEPALCEALVALAASGAIVLIRNARNQGFPRSANAGIAACAGRDVILLNSDTLVAPLWTEALREAVYAAPDIGTATPFSNDASILSYPDPRKLNAPPGRGETARLMALARAANQGMSIDIPTGNGFCWYLRRDCLDQAGMLREDLFAQGYGEENEFCLRARHLGWRHVAAPGAFVAHVGNVSFGAARQALMRRNLELLNALHPGYDALIQDHIARDPLADARRRFDRLRFLVARGEPTAAAPRRAVLLITHDEQGGVEKVIRARATSLASQGIRPIVLRPDGDFCLVDVPGQDDQEARNFPNLRYRLPHEMDQLAALLAGEGLLYAEWHHLLGHHPQIRTLCGILCIPYEVHVHDYASFCPRIALVGPAGRYCGEPDIAGCNACIAEQGSNLGEAISPAALRLRSAAEFANARRVVVPSQDAQRRIARHFPGIRPLPTPLEDDAPDITLERFADPDRGAGRVPLIPTVPGRTRIGIIGGIGIEKGYDIILACLRDASTRRLPLDFVVIGHTPDDDALFEAGCLDITGAYREAEAIELIRARQCDLAFLPSVWPETWCFTLGLAWRAGLAAAVFDIGAQSERVRRTGRGAVLPLGLPTGAVNDTLLRLHGGLLITKQKRMQNASNGLNVSGQDDPLRITR